MRMIDSYATPLCSAGMHGGDDDDDDDDMHGPHVQQCQQQ